MAEYEEKFNEDITLIVFLELDEKEQIKILKECIEKNQKIFENEYFNRNYIEKVE